MEHHDWDSEGTPPDDAAHDAQHDAGEPLFGWPDGNDHVDLGTHGYDDLDGPGASHGGDVVDHDQVLDRDSHPSEPDFPELGFADQHADLDAGHGVGASVGGVGALVGTDPDGSYDHDGWSAALFPPELTLIDRPAPADGYPWSDPGLLGAEPGLLDHPGTAAGAATDLPTPAELAAYDSVALPADADAWAVLRDCVDPATSALARWWTPE